MFSRKKVSRIFSKVCYYCSVAIDEGYVYSCEVCGRVYHKSCTQDSSCKEDILECGECDYTLDCKTFNSNICICCKSGFCKEHLKKCYECAGMVCPECFELGYTYDTTNPY